MSGGAQLLLSALVASLVVACAGASDVAPEAGAEIGKNPPASTRPPDGPEPPGRPQPPTRYPPPAHPASHLVPVWSASLAELVGDSIIVERRGDRVLATGRPAAGMPQVLTLIDLEQRSAEPPRQVKTNTWGIFDLLDDGLLLDVEPYRHVLYAFDASTLEPRWTTDFGEEHCLLDRRVIGGWLVAQLGECHAGLYRPEQLLGIGLKNGHVHWRVDVDLSLTWRSMWSDGTRVYLTRARGYDSPESTLEALDVQTGERLWSVPLPPASCGASSDGTRVLVDAPDGERQLLSADTGALVRTIPAQVPRCGRMMYGTAPNDPTAVVEGGQAVYFDGGDLVLVELTEGRELWRCSGLAPPGTDPMLGVAIADDAVFVRQPGDRVVAVNRVSGLIDWEWGVPGLAFVHPIEVVVGDGPSRPWLLVEGERLWLFERASQPAPAERAEVRGRLVAGEGLKPRDVARRVVLIGDTSVTTDRRGGFRGAVTTRGAVRVELVQGPPQWERDEGRPPIAAEPVWVTLDGSGSYEVQAIAVFADPDADG